jgi:hypothetical protein
MLVPVPLSSHHVTNQTNSLNAGALRVGRLRWTFQAHFGTEPAGRRKLACPRSDEHLGADTTPGLIATKESAAPAVVDGNSP